MKTKIISVILLSAAFILTGCGGSQSDPIKTAEKFAKAWYSLDYDTCNDLSEREEFVYEKDMGSMERKFMKEMQKEAKKMNYVIKVNKEETEIWDTLDEAYVELIITGKDGFKYEGDVRLSRTDDGKWFVHRYDLEM